MKGVQRFGKKEKLASRYIGPFQIMDSGEGIIQTSIATTDESSASSVSRLSTPEVRSRSYTYAPGIGGRRQSRFVIFDISSCHGRQTDQSSEKQRGEPGKDTVARTRVRRMHLGSGAGNERRIPPTVPIKR